MLFFPFIFDVLRICHVKTKGLLNRYIIKYEVFAKVVHEFSFLMLQAKFLPVTTFAFCFMRGIVSS